MMNLLKRAVHSYREKGALFLVSYSKSVFIGQYKIIIDNIRDFVPKSTKVIKLNGVEVPVETSLLDNIVPFYTPPHPVSDDPTYERFEVEALRRYAKKGDQFVIIGGGLGVTTVVASQITSNKITVYEQAKSTCKILKRTVDHNELDDVNINCAAVGDTSYSNFTHNTPSIKNCTPPSSLPNADIYEMDCEGAEINILKNMKARPEIILVETHKNHEQVVDILNNMGYSIDDTVTDGKHQGKNCTHIRAKIKKHD